MEKSKRIGGRPPHEPTQLSRRLVELLAGAAISQAEICPVLGVDRKTLRKYYRRELDRGATRVEAELIGNLHRLAMGNGDVAIKATMFILQSRFGWSRYLPPHA